MMESMFILADEEAVEVEDGATAAAAVCDAAAAVDADSRSLAATRVASLSRCSSRLEIIQIAF